MQRRGEADGYGVRADDPGASGAVCFPLGRCEKFSRFSRRLYSGGRQGLADAAVRPLIVSSEYSDSLENPAEGVL